MMKKAVYESFLYFRVTVAHNKLHEAPLLSACNPKFFKASVFRAVWKPFLVFCTIFYVTLFIYYKALPSKTDCKPYWNNSTKPGRYVIPENSGTKVILLNIKEFLTR